MIVTIGGESVRADGQVKVLYATGRQKIYNSKDLTHLILNERYVTAVLFIKNN